jgi:hypothetical protein
VKRVEIIANRSVQEDLMDAMAEAGLDGAYTLIPAAQGAGRQGRRSGEAAWPEENFILIRYGDEAEARAMAELVARLKVAFPHEGIKCYILG